MHRIFDMKTIKESWSTCLKFIVNVGLNLYVRTIVHSDGITAECCRIQRYTEDSNWFEFKYSTWSLVDWSYKSIRDLLLSSRSFKRNILSMKKVLFHAKEMFIMADDLKSKVTTEVVMYNDFVRVTVIDEKVESIHEDDLAFKMFNLPMVPSCKRHYKHSY